MLLEGLVRCGWCGAALGYATAYGTGGLYGYYRCTTKKNTVRQGCAARDVPMEKLEAFVIEKLKAYALDPNAIREAVLVANEGRDEALAEVNAELQAKKQRSAERPEEAPQPPHADRGRGR